MKPQKTIVTIQQLCEMRGYAEPEKVEAEAKKAGLVSEIAGTSHIYQEDWDNFVIKSAASQLSARSNTGKTLADTDQLGIVNSNLKRLPESIRIKERKLRAKEALYKSASTDNEKYILSGEIGQLRNDLYRHRKNLKKAQQRQKEILAERAEELKAMESEDGEASVEASVTNAEPIKE